MSRLDYSKWDALELSDDSDIEVHPNVDKASFIRWKQQDIHARREQRRQNIQALRRTREMNDGLLTQLRDLSKAASNPKEGVAGILKHINDVRDKAKREGIADTAIPKNPHYVPDEATGQPEEGDAATAKDMEETVPLETVLGTLVDQIETALKTQDEENVRRDLVARLEDQMRRVEERQRDVVMALDKEEKEDKKKITSDNIFHETFDKMMITKPKQPPAPAPTPAPAPAATTKPAEKKSTDKKSTEKRPTKKKTEKVVETLNSGAKPKALTPPPAADDSDDSEELITTPDALDFSKLNGFDASFRYIGAHPHLVSEKVADQILAEAFSAQLAGDEKRAKNCVFQALQLQYCNGLGKDGINLFYARMNSPDARARALFHDDVTQTYTRIHDRCAELNAQRRSSAREVESIQLQPLSDSSTLTIRIPDSTDPAAIEAVKQFNKFPKELREAMKIGTLEAVNKALAKIEPGEAERIVGVCNEYGFLDVEGEVVEEGSEEQKKLEERARVNAK